MRFLRVCVIVSLFSAVCLPNAFGQTAPSQTVSQVNVKDYGAKGDGVTDDTAAFQAAMKAVSEKGGTAFVPVGNYLIKAHLNVPSDVTLEGVWKIPVAWSVNKGSTLLAVEGEGSEEGAPFISLNRNSTIKGLTVFYPNQDPRNIKPYPWCVACTGGDNPSIIDCLLVNPYQAVDFGSKPSGRHYIHGLYGQPLRRGIFVDKCYDIGRIENVHFWPFWTWDEKTGIREWLVKNGEAFTFARTDWEYVFNTFVFGYGIGYRFIQSKDGTMNGNLLGIGADASNIAVLIDDCQAIGLLITNGEFVSFQGEKPTEVVVKKSNGGLVQFQNCSFWGPADQIARIAGTGTVGFNGCNFVQWDKDNKGLPAIESFGGNLLVNGCNFRLPLPQITLRTGTESAVVVGNRMAGPLGVANKGNVNAQIGLNVSQRPPERPKVEPGAIVLDDSDKSPAVTFVGEWYVSDNPGNYYLGTHWAFKGSGEAKAIYRPNVPKRGGYAVYVFFGPDPIHDHASNAPIEIHAADGVHVKHIDLRDMKGQWVDLGTYLLPSGRRSSVIISNNADGNVLADAVQLLPAKRVESR